MFANKTPIRRRISNYLTKFSVQVVILLQKWNHIIDCRTNDVTELAKTGVKLHFKDDFFRSEIQISTRPMAMARQNEKVAASEYVIRTKFAAPACQSQIWLLKGGKTKQGQEEIR